MLKRIYIKIKKKIICQKNNLLISLGLASFITLLCYFMNSCPYPYWDTLDKYSWLEYFLSNIVSEKNDRSDVFFINVSYDRQVVDYTYSNGNLQGTIDITNRETLLRFLKIAERTNTYKYIFLDIRFEKGIDPKRTYMAIERCANLLEKYADATVVGGTVKYDAIEYKENKIEVSLDKIIRVLVISITKY